MEGGCTTTRGDPTDQHTRNNSLGYASITYGADTFNIDRMKTGLEADVNDLKRRMDEVKGLGVDWNWVTLKMCALEAWKDNQMQFESIQVETMKERIELADMNDNSLITLKVS